MEIHLLFDIKTDESRIRLTPSSLESDASRAAGSMDPGRVIEKVATLPGIAEYPIRDQGSFVGILSEKDGVGYVNRLLFFFQSGIGTVQSVVYCLKSALICQGKSITVRKVAAVPSHAVNAESRACRGKQTFPSAMIQKDIMPIRHPAGQSVRIHIWNHARHLITQFMEPISYIGFR